MSRPEPFASSVPSSEDQLFLDDLQWQDAVADAVEVEVEVEVATGDLLTVSAASGGLVTATSTPYSHEELVQFLVAHPNATPESTAKAFGRGPSWFLQVLASDQFQLALDPHRHLIANPLITATMEERFRSLTLQALSALSSKLNSKEVSDFIVVKSAEIGVKALGMGAAKREEETPLTPSGNVDTLAERLVAALEKQRGNVRADYAPVTIESGEV